MSTGAIVANALDGGSILWHPQQSFLSDLSAIIGVPAPLAECLGISQQPGTPALIDILLEETTQAFYFTLIK
jgi:hypothetical protein